LSRTLALLLTLRHAKGKHAKAAAYVHSQLFAGLTSFAQLESRVAALPDEKARGDAFEVSPSLPCHATERRRTSLAHGSGPLDLLKSLGLTQQDNGVDGVVKPRLASSTRISQVPHADAVVDIWRTLYLYRFGDSPHIHNRVLLTNCDEISQA